MKDIGPIAGIVGMMLIPFARMGWMRFRLWRGRRRAGRK